MRLTSLHLLSHIFVEQNAGQNGLVSFLLLLLEPRGRKMECEEITNNFDVNECDEIIIICLIDTFI